MTTTPPIATAAIIALCIIAFALLGIVLHLAQTIRTLHQYIDELERDLRDINSQVFGDAIADKQKGGVT